MFCCFEHLFCKYAEKTFIKSVSSVKNAVSPLMYIYAELRKQWLNSKTGCWTAQTSTKFMLLHDKEVEQLLPHCPLYEVRDWWNISRGLLQLRLRTWIVMTFTVARCNCEIRSRHSNWFSCPFITMTVVWHRNAKLRSHNLLLVNDCTKNTFESSLKDGVRMFR
jgi:hypothetical protein